MSRRLFITIVITSLLLLTPKSIQAATNGPLHPSSANPNYFFDRNGKAVYLTGSHTWGVFYTDNFGANNPNNPFFDVLSSNNHNFMRFWVDDLTGMLEGGEFHIPSQVELYTRTTICCAAKFGNKFDLNSFNQSYFDHLREIAIELKNRGIYMSIMLRNGWWVNAGDSGNWENAVWPFAYYYPGNAIQSTAGTTKDNVYTRSSPVNDYLKAHMRKVVDTVKDLDNIMYEVMNEAPGGNSWTFSLTNNGNMDWQQDMANYVKSLDPNHPVGITTSIGGSIPQNNYGWFTADWTSPTGDRNGDPSRKLDSSKVAFLDTDHTFGVGGNDDWVWKAFTRGYNPIYMEDLSGNADALAARKAMGVTNYIANNLVQNLAAMLPNNSPCNTDFCLGNGNEMVAYYPGGAQNPNLGSGWSYEYYATQSNSPTTSGAKVVYAYRTGAPIPTSPVSPSTTPVSPSNTPTTGNPWIFCANEDGICSFPGTKYVRYGDGSNYNYGTYTNNVACNNSTFGDPLPAANKHCDYQNTNAATPTPKPSPKTILNNYLSSNSTSDLNGDLQVNLIDFALSTNN